MSEPRALPLPAEAIAGEAQTPGLAYAGAALDRADRHFRALGYALDDLRRWSELVRAERERAAAVVAERQTNS
jgi:hypothetical protein